MATKAPQDMTAIDALEAYGYTLDATRKLFVKLNNNDQDDGRSEYWRPAGSAGFHLLRRPGGVQLVIGAADGAGEWGRIDEPTGLLQVPYTQSERWKDASGLHPATHPECFEWTWPAAKVAEIHAYAYTSDYGHRWKRNDAGELVRDNSSPAATLKAE